MAKKIRNFDDIQPLNREQKRVVKWLMKLKFRRRLFGGVSESDVWKKISELNDLYDAALRAERVRYDALLEQMRAEGADGAQAEGDDG